MSRSKKSTISHKLEENKDKFQKPIEQGDHGNKCFLIIYLFLSLMFQVI